MDSAKFYTCPACGGDGKETCNNPDHGFYGMIGEVKSQPFADEARIGCPCCGHDPHHKVPNGGPCETCNGTGMIGPANADKFLRENPSYDHELEVAKPLSGNTRAEINDIIFTGE